MKKTLLTLALALTTVAAFGQGRVIFINDASRLFTIGAPAAGDDAGLLPITGLASGRVLNAILYAGTAADALALQTTIPLTGTVIGADGRMAAKNVVLTGVPGGVAQSFGIVLVDDAATAPLTLDGNMLFANTGPSDVSSSAGLFANATYFGSSGLFESVPSTSSFLYNTLVNTGNPSFSTWMPGDVVINAIPEPSTFALAGLGAAALLIFRRRK